MATPSKTANVAVLPHTAITHPGSAIGPDQDSTTKISARIALYHALVEGYFVIETCPTSSGDENWVEEYRFVAKLTTRSSELISGAESIGSTVINVVSTTGFVAGAQIYIEDSGTPSDSEWAKVASIVTDTSVNLVDGLTRAKDGSDLLISEAEIFSCHLDLSNVVKWRVRFVHEGTAGANCHVKALATTFDSFG